MIEAVETPGVPLAVPLVSTSVAEELLAETVGASLVPVSVMVKVSSS